MILAALCLGETTAHAQVAAVPYWSSSWPIGFGGTPAVDQGANTYGNFDGSSAGGSRFNFPNGMFIAGTSSSAGSNWNGFNRAGAFGNFGSLSYDGVQFGYKFGSGGGLPVTLYGGFDTLKYSSGISGSPFAAFDSKSGTLPVSRVNAGIEFQAAPNVSLSLGFGYVQQQSGATDSDINSVPGVSPIIPSGRR